MNRADALLGAPHVPDGRLGTDRGPEQGGSHCPCKRGTTGFSGETETGWGGGQRERRGRQGTAKPRQDPRLQSRGGGAAHVQGQPRLRPNFFLLRGPRSVWLRAGAARGSPPVSGIPPALFGGHPPKRRLTKKQQQQKTKTRNTLTKSSRGRSEQSELRGPVTVTHARKHQGDARTHTGRCTGRDASAGGLQRGKPLGSGSGIGVWDGGPGCREGPDRQGVCAQRGKPPGRSCWVAFEKGSPGRSPPGDPGRPSGPRLSYGDTEITVLGHAGQQRGGGGRPGDAGRRRDGGNGPARRDPALLFGLETGFQQMDRLESFVIYRI